MSSPSPDPIYSSSEMAFDLRSRYAEIVGDVLVKISIAREEEDYPHWFTLLDHLHTEINQKLHEEDRTEYDTELKECIEIINTNEEAYLGQNKDAKKRYAVHLAIKKLNLFLTNKMEVRKMFGAKDKAEGL